MAAPSLLSVSLLYPLEVKVHVQDDLVDGLHVIVPFELVHNGLDKDLLVRVDDLEVELVYLFSVLLALLPPFSDEVDSGIGDLGQ
jgi:hypothetical protein